MQLVQKYWAAILGVIAFLVFALPWLLRRLQSNVQVSQQHTTDLATAKNNIENKNANPVVVESKAFEAIKPWNSLFNDNAQKQRLLADAKSLVMHFGYHEMITGSIFGMQIQLPIDVSSWTENDAEIGKILRSWSKFYPALRAAYYSAYTNSQNLDEHILKWLDKNELKKTREHWAQYNLRWL